MRFHSTDFGETKKIPRSESEPPEPNPGTLYGEYIQHARPIGSIGIGIFTYLNWLILMEQVGKYTIHERIPEVLNNQRSSFGTCSYHQESAAAHEQCRREKEMSVPIRPRGWGSYGMM